MSTIAVFLLSVLGVLLLLIVIGVALLSARSLVESARTKEIWIAFASAIGGQLEEGRAGRGDTIRADINGWPAYVDSAIASSHGRLINYTRMRVFYRPRRAFEAYISASDVAPDDLASNKALFTSVAPMGLSGNIILRSNDLEILQSLLSPQLIPLIADIPSVDLQIRRRRNWKATGISNSIYEVYLQHEGPVASVAELNAMWSAMKGCIIQLHNLGIAAHLADEMK